jgi:membrane protein implicated in regulation of membrane protease activity
VLDRSAIGARVALAAALALILASVATPAQAYVGPGAGVSLFGAAIGFVVAIFSALAVLLLWPIRAVVRKLRRVKAKDTMSTPNPQAQRPGKSSIPSE